MTKLFVKRPGYDRTTYALVKDGLTVKDKRIDQINKDLEAGVSRDILEVRLQQVKESYAPRKIARTVLNHRLVEECHSAKVREKPGLIDAYALKRALIRAVEDLGDLSITEATKEELIENLAHVKQPGRRYHTVRAINELLRFAGRDLRLRNHQPIPTQIHFVETDRFNERLMKLTSDQRVVLGALIATGCRWGELPLAVVQGNAVYVSKQIRRNGLEGETKNKRHRKAPIPPPLKKYVDEYFKWTPEKKREFRLKSHNILYKAWKLQGFTIHDLRHSYAIAWAKQGKPLAHIALWIGDTEEVCKRHYSSYLPEDSEIEAVVSSWKG